MLSQAYRWALCSSKMHFRIETYYGEIDSRDFRKRVAVPLHF